MQAHAKQPHDQVLSVMRIAMALSWIALMAALLEGVLFSIGSANDNTAATPSSAAPPQPPGVVEAAMDPVHGSSDRPARPTCADLGVIASAPEGERNDESNDTLGCGAGSNLAGGTSANTQSEDRVDVATLLAWHVEANTLIPYAQRTAVSGPSRAQVKQDHPRRR